MNYTKEVKQQIKFYSELGLSSRDIAELLNISKSGVNDYLSKLKSKGPRVLFLDVETAPDIAASFGRFDVNLNSDNIITEGGWMISAAWSWLGENRIDAITVTPDEAIHQNDYLIAEKMSELYDEADIVVAHNGNKFDFKVIRGRMLINRLPPPKTVKTIDTLLMAKTVKFNSNKLEAICKQLELGSKIKTSGIKLWIDAISGNQKALNVMRKYNMHDVHLLKEVYIDLAPYYSAAPNFGVYYDDGKVHCPVCGSHDVKLTDNKVYTKVAAYEETVCNTCGARSRNRQNVLSKETRRNLKLAV